MTIRPEPAVAATSRKLLRSVLCKGFAAAAVEALAAAEATRCIHWPRPDSSDTLAGLDHHTLVRLEQGLRRHTRRRAEEMTTAALQVKRLGLEPRISMAPHDQWVARRPAADNTRPGRRS